MRRFWVLFLILGLSVTLSASRSQAGGHVNGLEPPVKSDLNIPTEVVVGTCILKAGLYIVMCNRENVTFTLKLTNETMAELSCRGSLMKDRARETKAVYVKQPSGYIVIEKLYLKGNNVEHIF